MLIAADEVSGRDIAGPVVVILFLVGTTIFALGTLWARMQRANSDYKKTKAALPGLRKDFWQSWWSAVKTGSVVALIGVCLILWWIKGAGKQDADVTPASVPSAGPSRR